MLAKIHVTFSKGVLDTQGKAVHHALNDLGFEEVKQVNVGKYMEIRLEGVSKEDAEAIKEKLEGVGATVELK